LRIRTFPRHRLALPAILATMTLAAIGLVAVPRAAHAQPSTTGAFDYTEALQDSMFFYEAQRSGQLPPDNEVDWRGDSNLSDGSDNGVNLTGGYHDAGDLVKFGLPEAWAMNMLAWSLLDYSAGYADADQTQIAEENLRWGDDYILSAYTAPDTFYGQVANPSVDHQYWGPAETDPTARTSYAITASCPGSDLAGQASAALAASSIVFKTIDPKYSAELLTQAESLFTFASTYLGDYSNCITEAQGYYNSYSGYWTQLVAAEIWLYKATGTASYLTMAETDFPNMPDASQTTTPEYAWTVEWDDDSFAAYIWMAQITGQQQYITDAENNLNWWTTGFDGSEVTYSPGGEAFLTNWGSLRYSANEAFLALEFSNYLTQNDLSPTLATTYHNFAVQQINYILGQNPNDESYEVGFTNDGQNTADPPWPQYPHNSTAHDSWDDNLDVPTQTRHLDYGLLVGGPDEANDQYTDERSNYEETEGAIDYNALFSGDLAALTEQYGGTPIPDFPPPETPDGPQIYTQAGINNEGTDFIELKVLINNQSAWPARQMPDASFNYYFTLDPGETASQITLSSPYNQCDAPTGPYQYSGSTYYVQVSCANLNIEPVGEDDYTNDDYQAQVQFRITFPAAHNPAEDWSFQGIPSTVGATPVTDSDITLYSGNTLVWGTPPTPSTAPSAPGSLTASGVTSTGATLSWTASTAGTNPIAGYDVYTSAGTLVGTTTSTSYAVTGLNADRTSPYGYYVQAVDSQGFASPASNIAQFITSPDTSLTASATLPPSEPGTPAVSSVTSTGATLTWGASVAGSNTLTGYRVYELAPSTGLVATVTSPSYTPTGLTADTAYAYVVEAIDSQDRTSQFATPATFYTGTPATSSSPSPSASPSSSPSPSPSPSVSPSPSPTPSPSPSPSASPTPSPTVSPTPPPSSASPSPSGVVSCTVTYTLINSWSDGFQAEINMANTGANNITPWVLTFTFPGDQQINDMWDATYTQSGESVTVDPESYDEEISVNSAIGFGFTGTFTNSDATPTSFTLNGTACAT
jgi:endoglucanase